MSPVNKATRKMCENCRKMGHIKDSCWAKGGGKEDQAPKWHKLKEKEKETESAKQRTEINDFAFITPTIQTSDWLSDSAASVHICNNCHQFITFHMKSSEITSIAPGTTLRAFGIRTVELNMETNGKIHKTMLRDIKYAPKSPNNLISIGCLAAAGHVTIFSGTTITFQTKCGIIFTEGFKTGHMYKMKAKPVQNNRNLYPIPSGSNNNNDNDIPVLIEGEQMCHHQREQPREAAQLQEVAQPQNEEAGTAQPSNHDESVTIEALCSSKRLVEICGKDYVTLNNPWYKSYAKPVDTVFISRDSSPIIAPDNFQENKSHDNHEICEAAVKTETDTEQEIVKIKAELTNSFQVTDFGPLTRILALNIDHDCENGTLKICISRTIHRSKFGLSQNDELSPSCNPDSPKCQTKGPRGTRAA